MPGRPARNHAVIYRVAFARPARKDSRVEYTTKSPEEIKAKYGDLLISIDQYHLVERIYAHAKG